MYRSKSYETLHIEPPSSHQEEQPCFVLPHQIASSSDRSSWTSSPTSAYHSAQARRIHRLRPPEASGATTWYLHCSRGRAFGQAALDILSSESTVPGCRASALVQYSVSRQRSASAEQTRARCTSPASSYKL